MIKFETKNINYAINCYNFIKLTINTIHEAIKNNPPIGVIKPMDLKLKLDMVFVANP